MEIEEVYQTPESEVRMQAVGTDGVNPYYVVSRNKFLFLYITTMGLYELYWMYSNWDRQRALRNENIWPIPRAIFSIFFVHQLFGRQLEDLERVVPQGNWPSNLFATLYVLLGLASIGIGFFDLDLPFGVVDLISLVLMAGTIVILMKSQTVANRVCKDADGTQNAVFTPVNYIFMALGSILWFSYLLPIAMYYLDIPIPIGGGY